MRHLLGSALRRVGRRLVADEVAGLQAQISWLDGQQDAIRSRIDVSDALLAEFAAARASDEYQAAFDQDEPLVTVLVPTYNRADLLTERCLPSLLEQTYANIEILVIGDQCTDDTAARVAALGDPRIRFEALVGREPYPDDPDLRWMVAGTPPLNLGLRLARGAFLTNLDDDDEHRPHRLESLLDLARTSRADLVFHPFEAQDRDGSWHVNEATAFARGRVTTGSVLTHSWFTRIPWDTRGHLYGEPFDWNRLRKIKFLGARIVRHPEALLRHWAERSGPG